MKQCKFYILLITISLAMFSCKHDNVEMIGPNVCGTSDNFAVTTNLTVVNNPVSLAAGGQQQFMATFNEIATWKIIITGTISGAKKTLSGRGSAINATWDGSTDNVFFFRTEPVTTSLEIPCRESIAGPGFTISSMRTQSGTLITDFDGGGIGMGWGTTPLDVVQKSQADSAIFPPQGTKYYHMKGTDATNDQSIAMYTNSNGPVFGLNADPDRVYFNVFIYGTGLPNSRIDLRLMETDGDQFTYAQNITWTGWKLISVKYADFENTLPGGNVLPNPDLCNRVRFFLKSAFKGGSSEAIFDYAVFTLDTPFQP
ncbi:MAG: hypothetical protein K2X86_10075 [Cytophagaceae bacterium]|nr:hypothetical protein [Cytophagaceae bacterium]